MNHRRRETARLLRALPYSERPGLYLYGWWTPDWKWRWACSQYGRPIIWLLIETLNAAAVALLIAQSDMFSFLGPFVVLEVLVVLSFAVSDKRLHRLARRRGLLPHPLSSS